MFFQQKLSAQSASRVPEFKRALIIRLGGLGDILLATPTVRALSEANPGIRIDFIVGEGLTEVLSGLPYIHRVIEFSKREMDAAPPQFFAFLQKVRRTKYDLCVNLHPSARTVLIGKATGAATRISFSKDRRRQRDTGRVRHAIDDFYKELEAIGIRGSLDRAMDFFVPMSAGLHVDEMLADEGFVSGDTLLVINPAATRLVNRWPVGRFADVCDRFGRVPGLRIAITGASADREMVAELKDHADLADRLIDFSGRLSIKELGALLSRADAFLTCDTGPLHIAAALNTPLVCLSGAADPDRTGPLSPRSTVLIDRTLPCAPCQEKRCRFGEDIRCMAGLNVGAVCDALSRLLATGVEERALLTAI